MSNFVYGKAKEALFNGKINLTNNNLKVVFLKTSQYIPNTASDEFLSDIPTEAKVYNSAALTNVSTVLGVLDADNINITYNGSSFEAIGIYQHGTSDSNSRLIAFIDTSEGLPFTGTAQESVLTLQWNNDSTKIISL